MQKKIQLLCLVFTLGFFGVSLAQREGFGYIDATFFTGINPDVTHLQTTVVAGDGSSFFVRITNPTDQDQTLVLDFVDQVTTTDGENKQACDRVHSANDFASTLTWDTAPFLVPANSGVIKTINLNYNYCFSGLDLGCLIQTQTGVIDAGSFDISLGKANFIDLQVLKDLTNCGKYEVKALPSYRYGSFAMAGYMGFRIGDDFSSMDVGNPATTGIIQFSSDGTGEFMYAFPNNGSGYMVLMKIPSYLSVGYTGYFDINNGSGIDFTNRIGLDSYVYGSGWYSKIYMNGLPDIQGFSGDRSLLVAGDANNNDYIGASDLALINYNITVSFDPADPAYDFDKDGYITSKDQAIMLEAVRKNGFWRYFKGILGEGLLTGDDQDTTPDQFPWNF